MIAFPKMPIAATWAVVVDGEALFKAVAMFAAARVMLGTDFDVAAGIALTIDAARAAVGVGVVGAREYRTGTSAPAISKPELLGVFPSAVPMAVPAAVRLETADAESVVVAGAALFGLSIDAHPRIIAATTISGTNRVKIPTRNGVENEKP